MSVKVVALDAAHPAHIDGWAALFEACHCSCYCRFWHFSGTTNEWLERGAFSPDVNRAEHVQGVSAGDPSARGLIALAASLPAPPRLATQSAEGANVVGWMKLTPRASVPKLRRGRVYGALDLGDDSGVYSVGCFLVHPEYRGRGVARALVEGADEAVRGWGGSAIESYPRRSSELLRAEEVWLGPERLYIDAGYAQIAGESPYPVYRKHLDRIG